MWKRGATDPVAFVAASRYQALVESVVVLAAVVFSVRSVTAAVEFVASANVFVVPTEPTRRIVFVDAIADGVRTRAVIVPGPNANPRLPRARVILSPDAKVRATG